MLKKELENLKRSLDKYASKDDFGKLDNKIEELTKLVNALKKSVNSLRA